jgi:ubiquitin C-terminal hydrolase
MDNFFNNSFGEVKFENRIIKNITSHLKNENENKILNVELKKSLTYQLYLLYKEIINTNEKSVSPLQFKNLCLKMFDDFIEFQQEDSIELLIKVINKIEDECKRTSTIKFENNNEDFIKYDELYKNYELCKDNKEKIKYVVLMDNIIKKDVLLFKKYNSLLFIKNIFNKNYCSFINEISLFEINEVNCLNCNYLSYTYEKNIILIMDLENSLEECFEENYKTKKTDEYFICPKCLLKNNCFIKRKIYKKPLHLFIQLNKFELQKRIWNKKNKNVEIPFNINIKKYCDLEIETCKNYDYKLIGFVEHHGETKNGGHYTADCLNILKNEWIHYDDRNYYIMDKNKISKNKAYLLIYSLI